MILNDSEASGHIRAFAAEGIDHIVEVAFGANIQAASCCEPAVRLRLTPPNRESPSVPFWPMVFKNVRVFFLGSDFPEDAKTQAARDLNAALATGWPGFEIGERVPLADIARAHELVDHPHHSGRMVVVLERRGVKRAAADPCAGAADLDAP